ncbi:RadC family protein [Rodentibacter haemolyticus]|uniref:DNA repair protein RadC n=1 Tax=Rodentibacter haemolyticus TaxID=2778911 RepID=A0ABX6V105_9PAST|nr:DNA repair protein RadC [Rodentibacter haemolyticus]QPB43293.1 DNA repair protein RadC [Rodentibacter haemolyticus]
MESGELMPREKLLKYGVNTLSDHELLAIFLRTGIKGCPVMQLSKRVLEHFGSLRVLLSADQKAFCAVKGLGITQFIQLQATTEMTKRYLKQEIFNAQIFNDPEIVKLYLRTELQHEEREIFMVLFLDSQHRLIKKERLFLGTINVSSVYPREIIKAALYCNAAALILVHNHPSGIAEPSYADQIITQKICDSAELMEIRILDHFIVGKGDCYSFAENRLL